MTVKTSTSFDLDRLKRGYEQWDVEALLERTKAMKSWLEVARECGCATPAECALFAAPGEEQPSPDLALRVLHVSGKNCRRPPAD